MFYIRKEFHVFLYFSSEMFICKLFWSFSKVMLGRIGRLCPFEKNGCFNSSRQRRHVGPASSLKLAKKAPPQTATVQSAAYLPGCPTLAPPPTTFKSTAAAASTADCYIFYSSHLTRRTTKPPPSRGSWRLKHRSHLSWRKTGKIYRIKLFGKSFVSFKFKVASIWGWGQRQRQRPPYKGFK